MRILICFLGAISMSLVFSNGIFAQSKKRTEPLAENASLETTQKWLAKEIKKFSKYAFENQFRSEITKVSNIKFEGCNISYRYTRAYISASANSIGSIGSPSSSSPTTSEETSLYSFNLKLLDTDVVLKSSKTKGMQIILLNTLEKKEDISFIHDPKTRYKKAGSQKSASFTIRETAAEQIKNGFIQAIKLCQATK